MRHPGSNPIERLQDEYQIALLLLRLLEQEQECLVNADLETLSRLTAEKAKTVAQVAELSRGRHTALEEAGFEASEAGMQAWMAQAEVSQTARQVQHRLLTVAQSCRELNRINGLLITQHLHRNQAAIDILRGGAAACNAFYGPTGQPSSEHKRGTLVVG